MSDLKPCPFCGGDVKVTDRTLKMSFIDTTVECEGCHMEFSYIQDFSYSRKARVAINESFEDLWNRRVDVEREMIGNLGDMDDYIRKVLRHEIVHAFLLESGLHECSGETDAWASNETMVDWFARVGPKIFAAWKSVGALEG